MSGSPQSGFQTTSDYILGPAGEQVSEMSVSATATANCQANIPCWLHTNVYAAGTLIATYDTTGKGLHFYFNDPLGSRRAQTDAFGLLEQTCASLPFGDGLSCTGSTTTPTEHHFTGKERDTESGNDYFGARYYSSAMGRFMSPDWSAKEEPVPYAKLDDPQTLNLYAYLQNNPLGGVDADGHDPCPACRAILDAMKNGMSAADAMMASTKAYVTGNHGQLNTPTAPPATKAALTDTGVLVTYSQHTGVVNTLDAVGNMKYLGTGVAGEGTGRNNPDAQNVRDDDAPRGNAGPLPRGKYIMGPMQDNPVHHGQKVLRDSIRLYDSPDNNMGRRDHNSFLFHDFGRSEGCPMAVYATRHAISVSGTNIMEVER